MKQPWEIIAYNLPTFLDVPNRIPTHHNLKKAADRIIDALRDAGYEIVKVDK